MFTDATTSQEVTVEYTFGYKKNADGKMRIFLHHSSVPYAAAAPAPADAPVTEAEVEAAQAEVDVQRLGQGGRPLGPDIIAFEQQRRHALVAPQRRRERDDAQQSRERPHLDRNSSNRCSSSFTRSEMLPPLAPLHHRSTLQLAADVHAMLSPESVLEPLLVLGGEGQKLPPAWAAELAAHAAHFQALARPAPVAVGASGYALDLRQAEHALGVRRGAWVQGVQRLVLSCPSM